jgi:hypothetical protein
MRGLQTKKERPAPKTRTLFIRSIVSRADGDFAMLATFGSW